MRKKTITLLEVMIAICIIVIASGVIHYKIKESIERKKFQTEVSRLQDRIRTTQKLAQSTQMDWEGNLKKEKKGWVFSVQCEQEKNKKLPSLSLGEMEIALDGKKIAKGVKIDFFASGKVAPKGSFSFVKGDLQKRWTTSELFQTESGKTDGPSHPL